MTRTCKIEPFITRNNEYLSGEKLTEWHRAHQSGSYHCPLCGKELDIFYKCNECEYNSRIDNKDE